MAMEFKVHYTQLKTRILGIMAEGAIGKTMEHTAKDVPKCRFNPFGWLAAKNHTWSTAEIENTNTVRLSHDDLRSIEITFIIISVKRFFDEMI